MTLKELNELGLAFVSLTEALDLTTPTGRALAGLLSVFAEFERKVLRERIFAGIAQARKKGTRLGRTRTAAGKEMDARKLFEERIPRPSLRGGFRSVAHRFVVYWLANTVKSQHNARATASHRLLALGGLRCR